MNKSNITGETKQPMSCNICSQKSNYQFSSTLLEKHKVNYYFCNTCCFVQTEKAYWLEEAYSPKILALDTGVMWRNLELSKTFAVLIYFLFNKEGSFCDFGGGYGIFTRLMRDIGFDFYLHDRFLSNTVARGFEYTGTKNNFELVTSIECFEHLEQPIEEIEKMLSLGKSILFTTQLLPLPIPQADEWFYYGKDHGQHIAFYSLKTLQFLATKYSLHLYTDNKFIHLLTPKKINPRFFNMLIRYTHKGLWWFVSRQQLTKGTFHWIGKDSNTIKQQSKR